MSWREMLKPEELERLQTAERARDDEKAKYNKVRMLMKSRGDRRLRERRLAEAEGGS